MVVTQSERDQVIGVLQTCEGKHSSLVILRIMKAMSCGHIRAGNLLKNVVGKELAHIDGFKVYVGGKQ